MPATDAALNNKEVNDRQSCARASQVARRNTEGRPESLNEVAALWMRLKLKQLDKLAGSGMHDKSLTRHKISNRTSERRRSQALKTAHKGSSLDQLIGSAVALPLTLLQEEVKLARSPTLRPGFVRNVTVGEPDHYHRAAAPINPPLEFSYALNFRLALHLLRPPESLFHLFFCHTIVDFLVVLPGQFRLGKPWPCVRRRRG